MNKSLKRKWVKNLRSGKYKQGQGRLRTVKDNSFCCLGVLCDTIKSEWKPIDNIAYNWCGKNNARTLVPLKTLNAIHLSQVAQDELVNMNDDENKSFQEIADWVKNNIPEDR
jgi:hypothetical protein